MKTLALAASLAVAFTAGPALACGGLFCDSAQPVTQAAERILFARDGDRVVMHVRLTWAGPPTDFGWLLPVPPDVETTLSSQDLFGYLEAFAPRFRLDTEFVDCDVGFDGSGGSGGGAGGDFGGGGAGGAGVDFPEVSVLSREPIGPYDRTILQGASVEAVVDWLERNGYQVPEGAEEMLAPYVQLGAAFVAIKLVPGASSGDVVPLALTFTARTPAIPLRPTATAANRDMGIIVHVLGSARAIPVNYRHVVINEGAIDWVSGGRNYTDVVSQAADEAGGRAFVTDFAGRHAGGVSPLPAEAIAALGEAPTWEDVLRSGLVVDADVARVLAASITETAPGLDPAQAVACPRCYGDDEVTLDGAAFVHRLREEVEAPRLAIARLFETHPYLTRLYTTMSPDEMAEDPVFDENPDLEDAWNLHLATRYITCDESGPRFDEAVIETASGLRFALRDGQNPDAIRRQNGETVRGAGVPAAAVIEQTLVAGQSRILTDRRRVLAARYGASGGGEGCGCTAGGGRPATLGLLLLGLVGLRRRR